MGGQNEKKYICRSRFFCHHLFFSSCSLFFGNGGSGGSGASSSLSTYEPVDHSQIEACFNEVNRFRAGSEAWYWNADDSTKTDLTGTLAPLTLDEDLCRAAQIRANEIVKKFSHERPDGTAYNTVLTECGITYILPGENLAAGSKNGIEIVRLLKEDNKPYSGQGHRRYLLGNFTKIGIAAVYAPDSKYKYYWAMELTR